MEGTGRKESRHTGNPHSQGQRAGGSYWGRNEEKVGQAGSILGKKSGNTYCGDDIKAKTLWPVWGDVAYILA